MARVFRKSSRMRTISLLLVLLSLTFCQKEERDYVVAIAFPSDPPSLDPLFATDLVSQKLSRFVFASLYEFHGSKIVPKLIQRDKFSMQKSNSFLEFSLNLQSGVRPADVLFSLMRLKNENSPRKNEYDFIQEITKSSEQTILLKLVAGTTELQAKEKLALPFSSIIKQNKFLETGEFSSFGPYEIIEWKKNEHLKLLLKNRSENQLPSSILIRILPQSTTSLFLFKKDLIDAFKLSDFMLTIPEADARHTIIKRGRSIQYIAINHKNECFDKYFRYALNYSIPRETIVAKLLEGKADTLIGSIPSPLYHEVFKEEAHSIFSYQPNLSREYLKKSKCYPYILDQVLEFRMRADDENQAKGRALVQALKDIGLKVVLKGMEKAPLYKENGEGKGDLTLLTWYADFPSIWNFLDPLFHKDKLGNGGNRSHFVNLDISKKLDEKKDMQSAKALAKEIESEAPWIFLWSIQENYLVSDRFIHHEALSDFL
jgi:peptide/nickel transport system substrate-binding protein